MERIAKFHKVSYEQFEGDWKDTFGPIETEEIRRIYEGIRLPARATAGSAGYDLYTPVAMTIRPGETIKIIDSDYFFSDNEGHIFVKLTNDTKEDKTVELAEGAGFAQGIFLPFGITEDDDCTEARNGGFGSTDSRKN